MQHNENTMYAYVYKGQNGTDNTVIATIDNQEKPLVSNCLDEIKNMSNLAINLAAQHNLRVKLVKYQKEQEIDFGMFFK